MRATFGRSSGTSAGTQLDWFICPSLDTTARLGRIELRTIANTGHTAQNAARLTNASACQPRQHLLGEERQLVQIVDEAQRQPIKPGGVQPHELTGHMVWITDGAVAAAGDHLAFNRPLAYEPIDALSVGAQRRVASMQCRKVADCPEVRMLNHVLRK